MPNLKIDINCFMETILMDNSVYQKIFTRIRKNINKNFNFRIVLILDETDSSKLVDIIL